MSISSLSHLAALPPIVENNLPWFVAGAIVVLGLFVYGFRDLARLSIGRIAAIASVCFRDAIRRRVLWITPLAMLGIIIVSQLQKPIDEQDAIRQTIKWCFFTTGLVVTIITIITAVTNLPREIESRVVYTIVTKPVTRFEIVVGKIAGFAMVSALILVIMGVFSLTYLNARSYLLGRQITQTLQSAGTDVSNRSYLEHFQQEGLLFSQSVEAPVSPSQYARLPAGDDRVIQGGMHDAIALFMVQKSGEPNAMAPTKIPEAPAGSLGAAIVLNIGYEKLRAAADAPDAQEGEAGATASTPAVAMQIIDARSRQVVITSDQIVGRQPLPLTDVADGKPAVVQLSPEVATQMASLGNFFIQLIPQSQDYLYRINEKSVALIVPDSAEGAIRTLYPVGRPQLRGSEGRSGQQLRGPERGLQPVAMYQFRNAGTPDATAEGQVPFELTVGLETSGADADNEVATAVEVRVYDRPNNRWSQPALVYPENRRTIFFTLPQSHVSNGEFDVFLTNRTSGHVVALTEGSLRMVAERGSFAMNFLLGSIVLWLLSILVATISLCCSTFLSWPIAAVLTVLIILGRWGVSNLDIGTGLGAQFAQEFFPTNAGGAQLVNNTVEGLTRVLMLATSVLPDIGPFGVTEQIERGITISTEQMLAPLQVLALFGLPLLTAAYVFLRNKEVAP